MTAHLSDEEILVRLVALSAKRAKEEATGHVRWLRPNSQIPRFGKKVGAKTGELDLAETVVAIDAGLPAFPAEPGEATLAIYALLAASRQPMSAADIARGFKKGGKRIEQRSRPRQPCALRPRLGGRGRSIHRPSRGLNLAFVFALR